jgi:hypothetical protein
MHQIDDSFRVLAQEVGAHIASKLQTQLQRPDTLTPEYLTPRQAAQLIGFSLRALEAMRARRIGPAYVKVGKAKNGPIRYSVDDVRAWMQSHREVTDVAR